jgi:hypothetical protein
VLIGWVLETLEVKDWQEPVEEEKIAAGQFDKSFLSLDS